mmetsp:Transcript_20594/g.51971  ORF Transcript_20594/g.51971 Transcript_20594/m.51971 type:complete len:1083 (-) Transcript_20594:1099-4347(-)
MTQQLSPVPLRVLHVSGSASEDFYFSISLLYAKAAHQFPHSEVLAHHAVAAPNGTWYLFQHTLDGVDVADFPTAKSVGAPRPKRLPGEVFRAHSLSAFLGRLAGDMGSFDVMVPHMFDFAGMTTYRALFEDALRISVCGPDMVHNVVAQDKALTRAVLQDVPGVRLPKGQVVRNAALAPGGAEAAAAPTAETVADILDAQLRLPPPFVVKPSREDNSRGVAVVRESDSRAAMVEKFREAFSYGDSVVVEEFIPGRELRAAVVERRTGAGIEVMAVPAKVEYLLNGADAIRTAIDKLAPAAQGGAGGASEGNSATTGATKFVQSSLTRRDLPAKISDELKADLERQTAIGFKQLGGRDYGIFDFRVHEETGEAYIIECCTFWSFSPISVISLLLDASSGEKGSFVPFVKEAWELGAERTRALRRAADCSAVGVDDSSLVGMKNDNEEADEMENTKLKGGVLPAAALATLPMCKPGKAYAEGENSQVKAPKLLRVRSESDASTNMSSMSSSGDDDDVDDVKSTSPSSIGEASPKKVVENALATGVDAAHQPALRLADVPVILFDRLRCLVHIAILVLLTPLSVLYAIFACLSSPQSTRYQGGEPREALTGATGAARPKEDKITVLVTGGKMAKSLFLVRCLKRADPERVRIVLVEIAKYGCCGSKFSNAVDAFELVADPRRDPAQYQRDLLALSIKYDVDFFVPVSSPASSVEDAKFGETFRRSRSGGTSVCLDAAMCRVLDNKQSFSEFCVANGLPGSLQSYLVRSDEEVRALNEKLLRAGKDSDDRYVLKNLAFDPMHRLDLFKLPCVDEEKLQSYLDKVRRDGNGISEAEPWQVQKFVDIGRVRTVEEKLGSGGKNESGSAPKEYCAAILMRGGSLKMLTISESSASQLNYAHIEVPAIENSVKKFCESVAATSTSTRESTVDCLICFDFMVENGVAHPLECNPRLHSQCSVFSSYELQRKLGRAVLGLEADKEGSENTVMYRNIGGAPPLFFFANEVLKALPVPVQLGLGLRYEKRRDELPLVEILPTQKEADFDANDVLPFLCRNHFQLPLLLVSTLFSTVGWKKCDFCIGKVVEVGGD